MMQTNEYKILAEVIFDHEYFIKGKCKGIRVEPTKKTQRILKENGIFFRKIHKGFRLFSERISFPPDTSMIPQNNLILSYCLHINEKQYLNVTHIEESPNSGYRFCIQNLDNPNQLSILKISDRDELVTNNLKANESTLFFLLLNILNPPESYGSPFILHYCFKSKSIVWRYEIDISGDYYDYEIRLFDSRSSVNEDDIYPKMFFKNINQQIDIKEKHSQITFISVDGNDEDQPFYARIYEKPLSELKLEFKRGNKSLEISNIPNPKSVGPNNTVHYKLTKNP